MPEINIDLHILKKIVANNKRIGDNSRKMGALYLRNEELRGENNALFEFVEDVCKEAEKR